MIDTLPSDLADFVRSEIAAGRFKSLEEMELEGLWLLKHERDDTIRGIHEGIESMRRGEGKRLRELISSIAQSSTNRSYLPE